MIITDACAGYLTHLDELILTGERKPKTRAFYAWQFRILIKHVGTLELEKLTLVDLANCPVKNAFRRCLRRLFKFFEVKIPRGITVPRCGQRVRILTKREYRLLRRAAGGDVPFMLALIRHEGLRPQEVRELEWDRIHEDRRVIELRSFKSMDRRQDGLRVRFIPLSRHTARLFALARAILRPHPEQLVFTNRWGEPWTEDSFGCNIWRTSIRADLRTTRGEQITAYSLRHTFATGYLRGRNGRKGDVIMLQRTLGHAQLTTTTRYCHPTEQDMVAARDHALG